MRPPLPSLVCRVYDRALHPECVAAVKSRRVERPHFVLTIHLTGGGHVVEFRVAGQTVTEVLGGAGDDFPSAGLRLERAVGPGQSGKLGLGELTYRVGVQAEVLPPELFAHAQAELGADAARRGVIAYLPPQSRLGLAPVGFVTAEPVPGGVSITAFHGFPAESALVRTQTLLEFPQPAGESGGRRSGG